MKLSRKVLIIVTIPVVAELALVSALLYQLGNVDRARREESYSRELIAHVNSAMFLYMQRSNLVIWTSTTHSPELRARLDGMAGKIVHCGLGKLTVVSVLQAQLGREQMCLRVESGG